MTPEEKNDQMDDASADSMKNAATSDTDSREAMAEPEVSETSTTASEEPPVDTLDDLKIQLDAQSDRYLRLMAEFDNFKKRVSRDYERLVESANEKLISELIEVRENFERAMKTGESATDIKTILDGMKLIFTKFDEVLFRNGLEPFGSPGDVFDPQLHDALMKTPHAEYSEDHIADVFEKGYYLKKRVLRHAKVIVSSGKPDTKGTAA